MSEYAIEAAGLRRTYRSRTGWLRPQRREVEAVRGVDLTVGNGELFGLLGPNGAGKTTTIKLLNTLLIPTAGEARVCGFDVVRQTREVRRRIGYVFGGDRGLYDRLSARDNLRYFAELYGVPGREQKRRIAELFELVRLTGRENDRVEGYSRGMRQRLHIARGLLHRPSVLFLDEPSIGVDPVAARELRQTVAELAATGTTVLLTTHYMAEADELCGRIAVIANGTIQALGTPAELRHHADGRQVLEVEAYGVNDAPLAAIHALPGVREASVTVAGAAQVLSVQSDAGVDVQADVLRALDGVRLGRVTARQPTLEDAYVAIVNRVNAQARPVEAVAG
ncbi:ABC transporter ATP-binding protein [Micromonospora parathelypteridis]|uniref:ABC-2 type transport system ATP-binding protein n=1 Tax=Micromonospora parathelypteridis TaxID=1839617 RepID=A0A840VWR9_9ACTN|nr:ABC transporter ATP-binding protein [Micromonospora parathelypteridis]MBB5477040.1 ABC-2 type transport system ATP-binding protein [Micromonospora parathelypteridis]GGO18226.1 daunorubicin resistance protein DrrA family ABC transporter ATP-binding protein [Micromonospora parathelypteridis]